MNFKDLLGFEKLITPKILVVLYWIVSILYILGGIFAIFSGQILSGVIVLVAVVGVRVTFELIMIAFKNNEYLKKIAEKSDQ